jgi:hypothetical protein
MITELGKLCGPYRQVKQEWCGQSQINVLKDPEKWQNKLLPSHQFGFILTTSASIMDHYKAR